MLNPQIPFINPVSVVMFFIDLISINFVLIFYIQPDFFSALSELRRFISSACDFSLVGHFFGSIHLVMSCWLVSLPPFLDLNLTDFSQAVVKVCFIYLPSGRCLW